MGKYPKNSFDRFGDDLTELVLSYLKIDDNIRLEFVSKQWQRLIHQKIFAIKVSESHEQISINRNYYGFTIRRDTYNKLKILLKKFTNLREIEFEDISIDNSLIVILDEFCPQLKSLSLIDCRFSLRSHLIEDLIPAQPFLTWLWSSLIDSNTAFKRNFGPKIKELKTIQFRREPKFNEQKIITYCPNVEALVCKDLTVFGNKGNDFLPKLNSLKTFVKEENVKIFEEICLKYGNQLKVLSIRTDLKSDKFSSFDFIGILRSISYLKVITDLKIYWNRWKEFIDIEKELTQIGNNCLKLKKFHFYSSIKIKGKIFGSLRKLESLEKLKLRLNFVDTNQSIAEMGLKNNIKHLIIISNDLTEEGFANIHRFVPNIKTFKSYSGQRFTENHFNYLSELKSLKVLTLGYSQKITDSVVKKFLDKCRELRKINFSWSEITDKSIENLIEFANKRPKHKIHFDTSVSRPQYDGNSPLFSAYRSLRDSDIPENLRIYIRKM